MMAQEEDGSGGMTDTQVRDEALTLFLAGHETTAVGLTWTLYLLSQHPEIEATLVLEIDQVLNGRLPTVDDLPALKYVEQVFAEGMRLYPPVWAIGRMVAEPYSMPSPHNWELEPGSIVIMSPYVTQHDARYFPEPERFDPSRWLPEHADQRAKFTFFPFGGGTRVCIGERLQISCPSPAPRARQKRSDQTRSAVLEPVRHATSPSSTACGTPGDFCGRDSDFAGSAIILVQRP